MNREQHLRKLIMDKFTSLRKFSQKADIPYSSLMTILNRGIAGASFDTVIKICKELEIDPKEI